LTAGSRRNKPDTRRTLLARRDSLTERERTEKSVVICERAAAHVADRVGAGGVIALYAHKGSEVETTLLDGALRGAYRVAYPRVVDESRVLSFYEAAIDELAASRWGLREPASSSQQIIVEEIAAFVIPGLAFDAGGGRIGWGKGHYDATLAIARAGALRIGLAFECQVVENVPRESHDAPLGIIITEVATHVVA
jgi:5-formyltetrahydrofolate cyclo-ligase